MHLSNQETLKVKIYTSNKIASLDCLELRNSNKDLHESMGLGRDQTHEDKVMFIQGETGQHVPCAAVVLTL